MTVCHFHSIPLHVSDFEVAPMMHHRPKDTSSISMVSPPPAKAPCQQNICIPIHSSIFCLNITPGECDVVFVNNQEYNNGQGMRIHLRLKQVTWWSYVQSVVVQIGGDTLEVRGGLRRSDYWVNGIKGPELEVSKVLPFTVGGHKVRFRVLNDYTYQYKIFFGDKDENIVLRSVKDWMKVDLQHHTKRSFGTSVGILGDYETGKMLARDGVTVFDEANTDGYGMEWQVNGDEPMLFHNVQGPQYPEQCTMPSAAGSGRRRRLGDAKVSKEKAAMACAHVAPSDKKDCVFDVMASDDLAMAAIY